MKQFMDEDFILSTDTAKKLFHEYAEKTPVLDYHCHLEPKEIAEDRKFKNIKMCIRDRNKNMTLKRQIFTSMRFPSL